MQILAPSERTVIFGLGDSLSKTHTFAYDSKYEYNKKSLLQKLLLLPYLQDLNPSRPWRDARHLL